MTQCGITNRKGFNKIDIVYIINLDHRTDRWEHINNELAKTNIDISKIHRISAIYEPSIGQLGCSKSHIKTIEEFLNTTDDINNALILEDDFMFDVDQNTVNSAFDAFFSVIPHYDIAMLAGNIKSDEILEKHSFITKVIKTHTTSGYLVNKCFAPVLLNNYLEGAELLEKHRDQDKSIWIQYAIDDYMNKIVPNYKWYCFSPKLGKQLPSYSDIEQSYCNYNV
jgi:GR25 family glycosyltransferase involved in LPS biosynthesis